MKIIKEYINEKFYDESDPIADMGIGTPRIIQNSFEKIFKNDYNKIFLKSANKLQHINGVSSIIAIKVKDNELTIKFFSDIYYDKYGNEVNKKNYAKQLIKDADISKYINLRKVVSSPTWVKNEKDQTYRKWIYIFTINPEYVKYFKNKEYYPYSFNLKESLNEKFTDESDPITDIGIGNKFTRIKVGDIVRIKLPIKKYEHQLHFDKEKIDSAYMGTFDKGISGIVSDIKKYKNELSLELICFLNLSMALNAKTTFERNITNELFGSHGFIVTYGKTTFALWNKYFEIVDQKK